MRHTLICFFFIFSFVVAAISQTYTWPAIAQTSLAGTQATPTPTPPAPFGRFTEDLFGVKLELVRVPNGTFMMGNDRSPNPEEKPAHRVNVRSFYLGQFEVTAQQWNTVSERLPRINHNLPKMYIGPGITWNFEETTPADVLFWDHAVEFCERLTRFTGRKYRLPSEAEWEYACRASTQTEYSFGDQIDFKLAHFRDITAAFSPSYWLIPVGTKGYANDWGLYDMHGNVAEWCLDHEHTNYFGAPTDGSAWTQSGNSQRRMQRGGYYGVKVEFGRSSSRLSWDTRGTVSTFGMRVAADISPTIGTGLVAATSAANYSGASLATESTAALFGENLASEARAAASVPLPTTLAGTSVFIKDSRSHEFLAPLFFVAPHQLNVQMPGGLAPGAGLVHVVTNGRISATGSVEITNVSPGLFSADASGRGLAAALALRIKDDGAQVYEPTVRFDPALKRFVGVPIDVSNPAEQVYLILFGTGFRQRSSLAGVQAQIAGVLSEVSFAGAQGDLVGVDQCNVRLLPGLAGRGESNVELMVDGKAANTIKLWIR